MKFDELLDALEDAPLVPEHAIDRVVDNLAFVATRWDGLPAMEKRRKNSLGKLTAGQLDVLQRLARGERIGGIASRDRRNLYKTLRAAQARLGAETPYQAVAIAVKLGLVEPTQEYVIGPSFCMSAHAIRFDRNPLQPSLRPVLVGICNGLMDVEIAKKKGCGVETVKSQVKILLKMYGVRSRAHLAAVAVRLGHVY